MGQNMSSEGFMTIFGLSIISDNLKPVFYVHERLSVGCGDTTRICELKCSTTHGLTQIMTRTSH